MRPATVSAQSSVTSTNTITSSTFTTSNVSLFNVQQPTTYMTYQQVATIHRIRMLQQPHYLRYNTPMYPRYFNGPFYQLPYPVQGCANVASVQKSNQDKSSNFEHTSENNSSNKKKDNKKVLKRKFSKSPKKKKKISERPKRGYTLENNETDQTFISVGRSNFYIKEKKGGLVTVSADLLELHHKFILHRISLDETNSPEVDEGKEIVHPSIGFNNNSQDCDCPTDRRDFGIHHNIFPGKLNETQCDPYSNNTNNMKHYRLVISPEVNFTTRDPTTVYFDGKDFCFEGYSMLSHISLDKIPPYLFLRNGIDYTVNFVNEPSPEEFCMKDMDLICDYLFTDIFELPEWTDKESPEKCQSFHLMPRFVHRSCESSDDDKPKLELLSMSEVLEYLMEAYTPFVQPELMKDFASEDWKDFYKESIGCLILHPKKRPKAIRVDGVVRGEKQNAIKLSSIFHTTSIAKSSKLTSKEYHDLVEQLHKAKKAVQSRAVPRKEDQELLWKVQDKVNLLKEQRDSNKWKDLELNCDGYMNTGLRWDICQHSSYLPGMCKYLQFIMCLQVLEERIKYIFKDKSHLKNALTHPSFTDQSTLSPQLCNMIKNLGKRHPHVEKVFRPQSLGVKKKGVINMTNVMATIFDKEQPKIGFQNNERLEFLGDAVLDYLSSIHLFSMLSDKGPGKLTAFRSGLVQKANLMQIANKIKLKEFILIDHRHITTEKLDTSLADAIEAIIGAVYLDGGLNASDQLIQTFFFSDDDGLSKVWKTFKKHPLQEEYPEGDRHLIESSVLLKKCEELESKIGLKFTHIRLLARALTHSSASIDDPLINGGNYERLEFLGDAILKYVCSDYLYKRFPNHQEGHLTLLRTAFINARCLSRAATELFLDKYIIYQHECASLKEKILCDVFEAFIGAVHIDRGIKHCHKIIEVCILSRLKEFIVNQEWLDPKSQLQQCCYSLNNPKKGEKTNSAPIYKRLQESSEGGVQFFKVGVYFNDRRLGTGTGGSCKEAEKEAARNALKNNHFEQYARQKKIAYRQFGPRQKGSTAASDTSKSRESKERRSSSSSGQSEKMSSKCSRRKYSRDRETSTANTSGIKKRCISSVGNQEKMNRSTDRPSISSRRSQNPNNVGDASTSEKEVDIITVIEDSASDTDFRIGEELNASDKGAETLESSDSSSDMSEGELYESVFEMNTASDLANA